MNPVGATRAMRELGEDLGVSILKGIAYLTLRQALFVGGNILLQIYLARKLGPGQYGIYGVLASFISLNEFILTKAAYETLSTYVAARGSSAGEIIKKSFRLFLLIGVILSLGYIAFADQIALILKDGGLSGFIRFCALIVPLSCLSTVYLGALNGAGRYGVQAFITATFVLVKIVLVVALVWQGLSVEGAILGILIAEVCQAGMAYYYGRGISGGDECNFRQIYQFALKLIAVGLVGSLVINVDIFAVKMILADNAKTGLYACALTIARAPLVLIYPVTLTMLPALARSFAGADRAEISEKIVDSVRYAMMMMVPPVLMILATHDKCIALAYGLGYAGAGVALGILLLGSIAFGIKLVFYNALVAGGGPGKILAIGVVSLTFELLLLQLLTPKMGIRGAAIASALTDVLGLALAAAYVFRRHMTGRMPLAWIRISIPCVLVYLIASVYSPAGGSLLIYYGVLMILFVFLLAVVGEINAAKIRDAVRGAARI